MARYVAQHMAKLTFPFKRYQLQKVWRGERPQKGRFREFYQYDIDIIGREDLPLACDAEVLEVAHKAFCELPFGDFRMLFNSRKLLQGFYSSLGLEAEKRQATITVVDKIAKIGADGVRQELLALGLSGDQIEQVLAKAQLTCSAQEMSATLSSLNISNDLFNEGARELQAILDLLPASAVEKMYFDMSLARGLSYYTGTILEVRLAEHPELGSVCGGGRYDDLAGGFINQNLPGVGISIGLTRILSAIFEKNAVELKKKSNAVVLLAVHAEDQRKRCNEIARELRSYKVATEVYPKAVKLGKQIEYALAKGIAYVGFVDDATGGLEMKNLAAQSQQKIEDIKQFAKTIIG